MIRPRFHHWTCSKFADFIRGTKKPFALGWNEWDSWHKSAKQKHPFRYWLAETFLQKLQNLIYYPYDLYHTIKTYINNRYVDKLHYLHTGLNPGSYYDLDYRILHGLFNELVIFVETECAWIYGKPKQVKNLYKFKNGSCKQAGLDYLDWGMKDKYKGKLTPFAKSCKEIKRLYVWWIEKRPNRKNPELDKWYEEDNKMLISLINIRKDLWT
jgi:hypothetical protein